MDIVRCSVITVVALSAPAALVAQERLMARGGGGAFSLTIEGTKQGVFPGGAIPGLKFSYEVKSPRDVASGQASGKRQHTPVVVTKAVGTASPQIFQALTTNEVLKSVVVSLPGKEGGGYTIKLSNATVSDVKQYTELLNGQAVVLEDVSFTFQRIEVEDSATRTMAVDDWTLGR
jgi:type VI secretion system secreted protein Hcp